MKKFIDKNIVIVILFLVCTGLLLISSCDKMDDIQKKYTDLEEVVYLGRIDSARILHDVGKVRVIYYLNADPKVEGVITYWNNRKDSIYKEFDRKGPGAQKDSIEIDNLPSGSIFFEFRTVNNEGETSLFSSVSSTVWGENKIQNLRKREISGTQFNFADSSFKINFKEAPEGSVDSLRYSFIAYTNAMGEDFKIKVENEEDSKTLEDFSPGGTLAFYSAYYEEGNYIDTLFGDSVMITAPTATEDPGTKISLVGQVNSQYSTRDGSSFYEWNTDGDLILYSIKDNDVELVEERLNGVPRADYNQLLYYRSDKFISTTSANALVLVNFEEDGSLTESASFGSGFSYPIFIPFATHGYFYGINGGTGVAWAVNDNATLGGGPPRGYTPSPSFNFSIYDPLISYDGNTFLGVDSDGLLWTVGANPDGTLGNKGVAGEGFDRFKKLISIGDTLLGIESNGDTYLFNDFEPLNSSKYLKVD